MNGRTVIVFELAGNAHNAQHLGRDPRILAKEAELVPDLDDEHGIHMLALDIKELDLERRELLVGPRPALGLALGGSDLLVFVGHVPVLVFGRDGLVPAGCAPPAQHAVRVAELLDPSVVQVPFLAPGLRVVLFFVVRGGGCGGLGAGVEDVAVRYGGRGPRRLRLRLRLRLRRQLIFLGSLGNLVCAVAIVGILLEGAFPREFGGGWSRSGTRRWCLHLRLRRCGGDGRTGLAAG